MDREKAAAKEAQRVRLVHIMETQFAAANSKTHARLSHSAAGDHAIGAGASDRAGAHAGNERCQWAARHTCVAALQPGQLGALYASCKSMAELRHCWVVATQAQRHAIFVQQVAAQHALLMALALAGLWPLHSLETVMPCDRSHCCAASRASDCHVTQHVMHMQGSADRGQASGC